jgi:hypothetical protein
VQVYFEGCTSSDRVTATKEKLIVLEDLAKTLERVLDRVDEMRKQERTAA